MEEANLNIEEVFHSAVSIVQNLPKDGPIKPSDGLKLKLYAAFKQATHGPNDTSKPRFYQIAESYKWEAWRRLGDMSKEDAMKKYIAELQKVIRTIPEEVADPNETERFKNVIGKKFYDYWFSQWDKRKQVGAIADSTESSSADGGLITNRSSDAVTSNVAIRSSNDTHSSGSSGSSMSMLEDTQSATGGDGYKTPTSLGPQINLAQLDDQFSLAILRLQHGLDETNKRVSQLERQLERAGESIQKQTLAKQRANSPGGSGGPLLSFSRLMDCVRHTRGIHWFYLSYPILIYALMYTFNKRKGRRSSR